jgi:hypothetical protein
VAAALRGSLRTEPGRRVADALRDYGGYLVDDTASDSASISWEAGAGDVFEKAFKMPLKAVGAPAAWYGDLVKIFQALHIVTNNAPEAVGGGGTPRMPPLPPLCAVADSPSRPLKTDDFGPPPAQLLEPADGAVIFCARGGATPSLTWDAGAIPRAVDALPDVVIEISSLRTFPNSADTVTDAVPAILARYVRAQALPLLPQTLRAQYFWRVGRRASSGGAQVYSEVRSFHLRMPALSATIPAAESSWAKIEAALGAAAAAKAPYLIEFEHAARTLTPPAYKAGLGSSGPDPPAFIELAGAADIVVDGGGSKITFTDYVTFVRLYNCTRVTVQNFEFDLDPLPYTALSIDSVDLEASNATVTLLSGHPTLEALLGNPQVEACCDGKAEVMTRGSAARDGLPQTKRGLPEVVLLGNYSRLPGSQGTRYSMSLHWGGSNPRLPPVSGVETLNAGDVIVVDPRIDIGFNIMGGRMTTLLNATVLACSNECFTSEHAESLSILGCGTKVEPGRFIAANNGGHNHHSAAVGQWIEGGTWESAGDDTVHVNGLKIALARGNAAASTTVMLKASGADSFAHKYHSLGIRIGDLLQFFQGETGAILATRKVLSVTDATASSPTARVTLDAAVGPGLNASSTSVFNFNRTSNQFVFRKNVVRNGRRVGVLYKGYRAWVDSNEFVGLGGGALELWNDPPPGCQEGLFAQTVLFRNNSVRDVCQLERIAAPVWTQAFGSSDAAAGSHSDLLIAESTFDTGPDPVFRLSDVADVKITGNVITHCATDKVLVTTNTQRVTLASDNTIHAVNEPRVCRKGPTDGVPMKTDEALANSAQHISRPSKTRSHVNVHGNEP